MPGGLYPSDSETTMFTLLKNKYWRNKEMVSYWKTKDAVEAKVTKSPQGHYIMWMDGEKYPFQGFPRGSQLFGPLSPLKHQIKNQIFNDIWKMLEEGVPKETIITKLKSEILPNIYAIGEKSRYDMVPFEKMVPPVRELHRAMTAIEHKSRMIAPLKDILTFIMQEDDAYRLRIQWIAKFFPRWYKPTVKHFDYALSMLEHAEIVGDMKERIRLLRRVCMFILQDKAILDCFNALFKEIDWKKMGLTKGDKYFFRAKYFKVDYPEYKY